MHVREIGEEAQAEMEAEKHADILEEVDAEERVIN